MIRLKQPLLVLNRKSPYSRNTYPESEIRLALEKLPRDFLYGSVRYADKTGWNMGYPQPKDHAFHVTNLHIENSVLYGDIQLLNNKHGLYLKSLPAEEVRFAVACYASFNKHDVGSDAQLLSGCAFIRLIEHGIRDQT